MAERNSRKNLNEVAFVNHAYEFFRFYDKHKDLCNELSGIKERVIKNKGIERKFYVGTENFSYGIKKLQSFIIDNLHYVPDKFEVNEIQILISGLEKDFLNDSEYIHLVSIIKRNTKLELNLQKKYFNYLLRSFEIGNRLSKLLQSSLMVSTRDIHKKIEYHDDSGLFENLARYRDEVSDNLANFNIETSLESFKYILSYYYTYKLLMDKNDVDVIETVIPLIKDYLFSDVIFNLIFKLNNDILLSVDELNDVKNETFLIKSHLSKIYYITNRSLSEKRILPKIQRKIFIDRSLI